VSLLGREAIDKLSTTSGLYPIVASNLKLHSWAKLATLHCSVCEIDQVDASAQGERRSRHFVAYRHPSGVLLPETSPCPRRDAPKRAARCEFAPGVVSVRLISIKRKKCVEASTVSLLISKDIDLALLAPDTVRKAIEASEPYELFYFFESYLRQLIVEVLSERGTVPNWYDKVPKALAKPIMLHVEHCHRN
jgi:hypothetical protein